MSDPKPGAFLNTPDGLVDAMLKMRWPQVDWAEVQSEVKTIVTSVGAVADVVEETDIVKTNPKCSWLLKLLEACSKFRDKIVGG